jgi:hypothetical protein
MDAAVSESDEQSFFIGTIAEYQQARDAARLAPGRPAPGHHPAPAPGAAPRSPSPSCSASGPRPSTNASATSASSWTRPGTPSTPPRTRSPTWTTSTVSRPQRKSPCPQRPRQRVDHLQALNYPALGLDEARAISDLSEWSARSLSTQQAPAPLPCRGGLAQDERREGQEGQPALAR